MSSVATDRANISIGSQQAGIFATPESLSTMLATQRSRRVAIAAVLASALIFVAVAPFARTQLPRVEAFIPIYETALVINDLITVVLLFGQFNFRGSRSLLVLGNAYFFTALITVAHALSFPGLFAPSGLLGAGMQTTAWLYMFWHGVFPLLVIAYALLDKDQPQEVPPTHRIRVSIVAALIVVVVVCALTFVATRGERLLPAIMQGNVYTPAMIFVVTAVWVLSVVALVALWKRRPHTVLDMWLMVVMCAWIFDIALSAILNAGRFDVGFYAGRIYGLLASGFVLIALLFENNVLYARLFDAHQRESRERQRVLEKTRELIVANNELDSFTYSVSHDLRAPLRAVDGYARMLEEDYAPKLDQEGIRLLGVVRASSAQMARLIDDLLHFSRLGREPLRTEGVDMSGLVQRVIDELRMDHKDRNIEFRIGELGIAAADPALLKHVFVNLIGNAVKFTSNNPRAAIEIGRHEATAEGAPVYFVKDNGAGFDMKYYNKLFGVFQRLHSAREFPGTGVGLAIVNRVIARHGGRVWAESTLGEGAAFYFTLGASE